MVKALIGKNSGLTNDTLGQVYELVLPIPRIEPEDLSAFNKSWLSPHFTRFNYGALHSVRSIIESCYSILSNDHAVVSDQDKLGSYGMKSEKTLELVQPKDSLPTCVTYILLVEPPIEVN